MREWRKSALPKVPVTRGGAGPLGVLIITDLGVKEGSVLATNRLTSIANVAKHLLMSHLLESNLAPIAMSQQVLESMQRSSKQAVCLAEVGTSAPSRSSAMPNAPLQGPTDVSR